MNENEENQKKQSSNDELQKRFTKERLVWKQRVTGIAAKLKEFKNLPDVEVDAFSNRQIALEYTHFLMELVSKVNASVRKMKKQRFLFYSNDYDQRLDKAPREMFINVDLEQSILKKELLDNHLSYMRGTVDSIDKIIYGIKWRISFEEYRMAQHK